MEVAVISAARWVVGKALAPFSDDLLEAWAASKELGPNVEALKTELLCTQGILNNTSGREIDNQALNELLQKLRDLAYNAEDVLDELDYFRFQDELEGTYEAADEHAKGCVCNLFLNAHHTAKAVGKLLWFPACSCAASPGYPREPREEDARQQVLCCAWPCARRRSALDNTSSLPHNNQANEKVSGCMRKLASGARNTIRDVGKRLHCSSLPFVHDDDDDDDDDGSSMSSLPFVHDDDDDSSMSVLCGACMRKAPQGKHAKETPKLELDRVDLSRRMKHIVEQLQPVCAKVTSILSLELLGSTPGIAKSRPSTTSDIVEPEMRGRELQMNSIIDRITQDEYCGKNLTILPIVGPGGIGKTTLVQHIYHSQKVQNHFQVRVWNCVSQNFNVNKLTEEIKQNIPRVECEKENATARELIEQRLKSKRFLLILDDIWKCEYEDWKRFLVPLTKGQAKGNIILVTTRFPAVAEIVKSKTTQSSIDLEGLDPKVFMELFLACVFDDQESRKAHSELLDTGGKIAEKLKGNPLAAKTVGRLLRNHLDLKHWTIVLESREWELQTGDHDIMPALKLSYDYLPFHLQQCFSYCALFPEDHKFGSEELIHFWIGLDILRYGGQNKSIEDTGLSNLNELVTHGFFKKDDTDGLPCYLIHDLLHDLSLKVASHECVSVARSNVRSVQIRPSVRHLSIIMDNADDSDGMTDENFRMELGKLKKRLKVENLQTLMIFGKLDKSFAGTFGDLFREANALRVLSLPQMYYPVESMLHNFSESVHLRYLRQITFGNLHLPSTLSRFYHLRILDLPNLYFHTQDSHDLPRGMSNLVKLRHFLTKNDEVHSAISNVGKLQFLQELRKFRVNKENNGFELKQLEHLIELTELGICNLEKIHTKEEAAEAKLVDKNHLLKLTLEWESNGEPDSEALVLESLRPQNNLEELRIRGHGGPSCPSWLGHKLSVKALKSLHLVGVAWKILPSLGQMWVLQELTLEGIATLNEFGPSQFGLITEQSFHHLKKLKLIGLNGLKKWVVGDACHLFSGLRVLIIRDCPELSELPFMNNICYPPKQDENIHWLPELQEFEIHDCPKVLTLPPIPWTPTLCSVKITNSLRRFNYSISELEIEGKAAARITNSQSQLNYSNSELRIEGTDNLRSLDEVVSFNSLTELRKLDVLSCPTLESKHLRVLTSLKKLGVYDGSTNVFVPLGSLGDVEWQLPIEYLQIRRCTASGKELTHLLSHLPKLAELIIGECEKITRMGVEVEQQQRTGPVSWPSSSAVKMEDTQATDQQQQIAEGVEEEEQDEEDGLLLFPAHLSNSLRELEISECQELILVASPPLLPNGHKAGVGGGLQALRSLQKLIISSCPKLLSAYSSSSCCAFPSSLQHLSLEGELGGIETLEPLSNLTSLTRLHIYRCGEDLRGEGLWPLLAQGQLSELTVLGTPKFFAFQTLGDQEQQLPKLSEINTDDIAGVLAAPICSFLSSSLTDLNFEYDEKVERFTKEQEEALHLLTSLQKLRFDLCEKLQCLPAGLHRLTNLKILEIYWCSAIRSLPEGGLPNSLQELSANMCDEVLEEQCRRLKETFPKIRL